jgi:hypothetical protein
VKHIREWFSEDFAAQHTDPYWDEPTPWYRKQLFTHWGKRMRLEVGDIVAENEHEGGGAVGVQFGVDLRLWEDVDLFPELHTETITDGHGRKQLRTSTVANYHDHSFLLIFWRWGIYLAWRGGRR